MDNPQNQLCETLRSYIEGKHREELEFVSSTLETLEREPNNLNGSIIIDPINGLIFDRSRNVVLNTNGDVWRQTVASGSIAFVEITSRDDGSPCITITNKAKRVRL